MTYTNETADRRLEEARETRIDKATAREWRRRFVDEMPHMTDRVDDFDSYAAAVPAYWDFESAKDVFMHRVQAEKRREREAEEQKAREAARAKTREQTREGIEAELASRKEAWIDAGGSEESFEAARHEIEAEIVRERLDQRRRDAVDVRDLL